MRARATDRMFWAIYEVQQMNMPLQQMRGQRNYERTRRPSRFFRQWCLEIVAERGEVLLKTIVAGVAELFDCSTTTTTRYLKKLTSEFGPLQIRRNSARQSVVVLKENHEFNIEESPN